MSYVDACLLYSVLACICVCVCYNRTISLKEEGKLGHLVLLNNQQNNFAQMLSASEITRGVRIGNQEDSLQFCVILTTAGMGLTDRRRRSEGGEERRSDRRIGGGEVREERIGGDSLSVSLTLFSGFGGMACVSECVCVSYDMYCMSGSGDMARQCVRMCV